MVKDVPSQRKLKLELSQAWKWVGSAALAAEGDEENSQDARFSRLSPMLKEMVLLPGVEPGVAWKVLSLKSV